MTVYYNLYESTNKSIKDLLATTAPVLNVLEYISLLEMEGLQPKHSEGDAFDEAVTDVCNGMRYDCTLEIHLNSKKKCHSQFSPPQFHTIHALWIREIDMHEAVMERVYEIQPWRHDEDKADAALDEWKHAR